VLDRALVPGEGAAALRAWPSTEQQRLLAPTQTTDFAKLISHASVGDLASRTRKFKTNLLK